MRISKVLLSAFFVLFLFVNESCKKAEVEDYLLCGDCSNAEISGNYTGNGQYYTDNNQDVTEATDVNLSVNNTDGNLFELIIEVPEKFSTTYFAPREDSSAAITISGTSKSINLTIYRKENEYRINGTAKVYHTQGENDTLFIDHSISFTVFK